MGNYGLAVNNLVCVDGCENHNECAKARSKKKRRSSKSAFAEILAVLPSTATELLFLAHGELYVRRNFAVQLDGNVVFAHELD